MLSAAWLVVREMAGLSTCCAWRSSWVSIPSKKKEALTAYWCKRKWLRGLSWGRLPREGKCQADLLNFFLSFFFFYLTFNIYSHQRSSSLPTLAVATTVFLWFFFGHSSSVALAVLPRSSFSSPSFVCSVPITLLTEILSSCLLTLVFSTAHLPCLACKFSHLPTQMSCLSLS